MLMIYLLNWNEIGQWWGTDSNKKRQIQIDLVGVPAEGKGLYHRFMQIQKQEDRHG